MEEQFTLTVNGKERTVSSEPQRLLLDVLREDLHLTGTKKGCLEGMCRSCTVFLNGKPVLACMTPVAQAAGKTVVTIEGLAEGDKLHPVQQAFVDENAMQCGYCTPGMIMRAAALLQSNPKPTDDDIVEWMDGNICRCNGYPAIMSAIHRAAGQAKEGAAQ